LIRKKLQPIIKSISWKPDINSMDVPDAAGLAVQLKT